MYQTQMRQICSLSQPDAFCSWDKAWYRAGLALRHLDRHSEAATAFHRAAVLSAAVVPGGRSCGPSSGRSSGPSGTTSIAAASAGASVTAGRGATRSGGGASASASAGVTGRDDFKNDGIRSCSGGGSSGGSDLKAAAAAVRSAAGTSGELKAAVRSGAHATHLFPCKLRLCSGSFCCGFGWSSALCGCVRPCAVGCICSCFVQGVPADSARSETPCMQDQRSVLHLGFCQIGFS